MKNRIIGALIAATVLIAGAAAAYSECFQPTAWPPPLNMGAGNCETCQSNNMLAAGKSFPSKIIGATRPVGGGATIAYVFGYNYSSGVDTPIPSCYVAAKVVSGSTQAGCANVADADYSRSAAGACNSANHWYLDAHN